MSDYPPQQYSPQGYDHPQYQSPPYPDHFPGEAPPPRQTYYSPPPQQQYISYTYPHTSQQKQDPEPAWDPKRIYAEYGAGPKSENKGLGDFSSNQHHQGGLQQSHVGQQDERGIGATVLGGAGGAFLGHEMGHGKLATLSGLAIGAIAANAFEHHHREKKKHEREGVREYDRGFVGEEERERERGIGEEESEDEYRERCRGINNEYEDERDYDDEEERPRHHHHYQRDYDDSYVDDGEYQVEDYYRRDY
ncbi:uncharacterized protein MYCFIDRAFT_197006 [Pseudocercospora fijiensis CIRAD86]|uniref:Glycine zipper 2TM domain-containing protein n=1 Tax=Pseudocercospora fijiensis (strain CIRAD86) TaxID=383855 RepID=M3AW30_PSEFD|nr:uncharacterized protein MYCFIDRAFT_197006 [Pseudocercospora fijiensis CIRAD86]EME81672.1 hypothetical protein MYCFIDRAFT_197006 [Pseudocercospora fijiensis CIRAD86]